ncbi:chromosome partitioning protein [Micromonospora chalcea]|uniref:chromosome partitioning protein n=1 Tax=Micromonospora chalcea TaxID=1874 RepID=UPI0033D1316F
MVGAEIVVGYLIAWAVRKVKLIGGRLDNEVDNALSAGLDRLHDVVEDKLGGHPALAELEQEAASGEVTDLTRQQVELAIRAAEKKDAEFARLLAEAGAELEAQPGAAAAAFAVGPGAAAAGGRVDIRADHGSAAAMTMRDVTLGPPSPGEDRG